MEVTSESLLLPGGETDPLLGLANEATEVYLIRHAHALSATNEVSCGSYDDHGISELGHQQSLLLSERLKKMSLSALYSSPTKRAWQTACIMAQALSLSVSARSELREVGIGQEAWVEGVPPDERARLMQTPVRELVSMVLRVGVWSEMRGCEPSAVLRRRMRQAVEQVAGQWSGKQIGIVTHAGSINAYVAEILGLERDFFFVPANTSISVVRVKGEQHLLISLNDSAHWSWREAEGAG